MKGIVVVQDMAKPWARNETRLELLRRPVEENVSLELLEELFQPAEMAEKWALAVWMRYCRPIPADHVEIGRDLEGIAEEHRARSRGTSLLRAAMGRLVHPTRLARLEAVMSVGSRLAYGLEHEKFIGRPIFGREQMDEGTSPGPRPSGAQIQNLRLAGRYAERLNEVAAQNGMPKAHMARLLLEEALIPTSTPEAVRNSADDRLVAALHEIINLAAQYADVSNEVGSAARDNIAMRIEVIARRALSPGGA